MKARDHIEIYTRGVPPSLHAMLFSFAPRILGIKLLDHIVLGGASTCGGTGFASIRTMRPDIFA